MSRIFLSHSSSNNPEAVALRDWLKREGWDDVFLDVDPDRGISAGERWEHALHEATSRCEAVLFLVSREWLASGWCLKEFNLAYKLNKRLFGLLIEDVAVSELPINLTSTWQLVRLCSGIDHILFRVVMPFSGREEHVTFSAEALGRLKTGLQRAGLDPRFFAWPPEGDRDRPPYRGLRALEGDDAGIFFGRDAAIVEALDRLRGLRDGVPPRFLVILGASGAGKSSFLRAGLLPRLARDDAAFLPLPIVRPERAAITGESGLLLALEGAFAAAHITIARAELRAAIGGGTATLRPVLEMLARKGTPHAENSGNQPKPPALILSIDQGEELFLAEAQEEAEPFLVLLHDLMVEDSPAMIVVFTIRSDNYEHLQLANELEGIRQQTLSLAAMPKGSYSEVIKGPAGRLAGTTRALTIDDGLVEALLADIELGGDAKDALPLLAFALERLYQEFGAGRRLRLTHYDDLGRLKGSIDAAVLRAFKSAEADPSVPKDPLARQALLRRGLIPWLAGIDPDSGAARRRVARLSEIPAEARQLIQHFVEQRLLATDVARDSKEQTIEPAHEAVLRQWDLLQGWLTEDSGLLTVLDGVKRAARDWARNGKSAAWLTHVTGRLEAAGQLGERRDLASQLSPLDREYLATCRKAEAASKARRRSLQGLIYVLLVGIIAGLVGWIEQAQIKAELYWYAYMRPYMQRDVRPYVLTAAAEQNLTPLSSFRECAKDCPEMIVVPAGAFTMGSPETPSNDPNHYADEYPQHAVTLAAPFAVSKFDVTFADWDACVSVGGCPEVSDSGFGRGPRPVINVTWDEAEHYAEWYATMTGRPYRLLSEAEWEYAARAGTPTAYYWGDSIGVNNADCNGCGSKWDNRQTAPVGSFAPNRFGLYDMSGNVWQWTQDCYHDSYNGAPNDGSAWLADDCSRRVRRGGGWAYNPPIVRSANRGADSPVNQSAFVGFRIGRALAH